MKEITSPNAPDEKVMEVIVLGATGYSGRLIEKITGVPRATVGMWLRSSELRDKYQEEAEAFAKQGMAELKVKLTKLFTDRVDKALDGRQPFSDAQLAVNYGIVTDKSQRAGPVQNNNLTFVIVKQEITDDVETIDA